MIRHRPRIPSARLETCTNPRRAATSASRRLFHRLVHRAGRALAQARAGIRQRPAGRSHPYAFQIVCGAFDREQVARCREHVGNQPLKQRVIANLEPLRHIVDDDGVAYAAKLACDIVFAGLFERKEALATEPRRANALMRLPFSRSCSTREIISTAL